MNAKASRYCLTLVVCFIGHARAGDLSECVDGLKRRADVFLDSESVLIRCSEENLQHLLITPEEDRDLQELISTGDTQEAVSRYSSQTIMRTPGYSYEFALRNNRIYQRVVNPYDSKYGNEGVTGVFDGTFGVELHGAEHAIVESSPPAYSWQNWEYGNLLNLNYFRGVDQFKLRDLFPKAMRPLFLPEDLNGAVPPFEHEGNALLDKVECIVLSQTGKWRWWLDPARGWAALRREKYVALENGHILISHTAIMDDLREEKPGLWLPRTITQEQYVTASQAGSNHSQHVKPAIRWTLAVHQIEFDSLNDSFFEPELPPGILVHDNIRKLDYVADDMSGIPFSKAIETAAERLGYEPEPNPMRATAIAAGISVFLILLIGTYIYRKKVAT